MRVFLETQRLVLRWFTESDVDNLVSLDADPDVMRFVTGGVNASGFKTKQLRAGSASAWAV
jgi:RimJ/RimL family protein N-acetyltransferase